TCSLGTCQSRKNQDRKEKWTASWRDYGCWPETSVTINESAVGGEKESRCGEEIKFGLRSKPEQGGKRVAVRFSALVRPYLGCSLSAMISDVTLSTITGAS